MKIPVCLITDNNYVMPTLVCLESMRKNKNSDSEYEVYILTDNADENAVEQFNRLNEEKFKITVLKIDNKYKDLQNKNDYVTNAAFLKFDIPNLLNQYSKILYIDTDTIILQDLTELYNTELNDTYAGVVLDVGEIFYKTADKLSLNKYFNSGMILFNAEKCRNENMAEKLLKIYLDAGESFICHDQDTFNLGFEENITLLSPIYNYQQSITEYSKKKSEKYYDIKSGQFPSAKNAVILHYTRMKPWIYKSAAFQNIWAKYYKECNFNKKLNLKSGIVLKYYFIIRNKFNLKMLNTIIKKIKNGST